jgi:citrate lyase beta subunit
VSNPDSSGATTPDESARSRTDREPRLGEDDLAALDAIVAPADERMARLYPGDGGGRQPVHTVYLPADRMTADVAARWGKAARRALDEHASSSKEFAAALGLSQPAALEVNDGWGRILAKLATEPIEDLRIDLEDGYGIRDDDIEDRDAVAAARALTQAGILEQPLPFCGIRFKALEASTRRRGLRTLDLFLGTLLEGGDLPAGFVATLPKVTSVEQVEAMVAACARLESAYGLADHRLRFEIQIETAQSILAYDGTALVARLVHTADGRCAGLHFGTYDYTAALGVSATYQAMDHPAAEHAKQVMALAAAQTAVRVSDGSTNLLPVGDTDQVHRAWSEHARLVRRSLQRGFYQGWDLHPAQLPSRYAATYLFFLEDLPDVLARLHRYLGLPGGDGPGQHLDEPATAQALATFLVRGLDCGAIDAASVGDESVVDDVRRLAARRVG